jgi:drug/metabolite transporter (DMT)-like permease
MKIAVAFAILIGFSVAANLLLKIGASAHSSGDSLLAKAMSWQVLLGISCFGASALVYFAILSWLPLSVAQSFAAAQFVAVVLAAFFVLQEPVNGLTWVGISLIALGISIVGWAR